MKKKLLTVLIILVLALSMIVATACGDGEMFSKNNERDVTQITASVSYGGRNSQVTKLDLSNTINNWVYQYYSYYQQGYITESNWQAILENLATSFTQANESLAETEAYTLKCIAVLFDKVQSGNDEEAKTAANAASTVNKAYNEKERIAEIESLLSPKYLAAARKSYNEEMQEAFDSYREAYETELQNGARNTKSTENIEELILDTTKVKKEYEKGASSLNLNGLKVSVKYKDVETPVDLIRSDYTVTGFKSDEVTDKNTITVTFGTTTATFDVKIVAAKPSRPAMPKEEEEEEVTEVTLFEKTLEADKTAAKASDIEEYKILVEAERRMNKSLENNYRTMDYYYLSKLKTEVVNMVEEMQAEDLKATGAEIQAEYDKNKADQKAKLLVDDSDYASTITDAEKSKTQIVHTDEGYFYVQHVLFKLTDELQAEYDEFKDEKTASDEKLEEYLNSLIDQVPVYISNVEYDKDAECESEDCDCPECTNYKGTEPGACDGTCTCVKCSAKRFVNDDFIANTDKYVSADGFALNGAKVNEDKTINVHEVLRAMYADLGTVGENATLEERQAILDKFEKWIYMCNDDEGFFTTLSDGKLGYALGKTESEYVANFTALSRALAYGTDAENWDIKGSGVGAYGYCYTEYGIHVIMLAGYAADNAVADGTLFVEPLTAVSDITEYKAAESETEIAEGTIASYLGQSIIKEKQDEAKGKFKKDFYKDELEDESVTKITYNDKVYQDLIDAYNN